MKKKLAVLYSNFGQCYMEEFAKICKQNDISIDFYTFEEYPYTGKNADNILYMGKKPNTKNIKQIKEFDKKLRQIVQDKEYDYIITDCLPLSFTCNVFHLFTLSNKIKYTTFPFIRFIYQIGHWRRLLHEKTFYKNCPKTIVVSNAMKADYSKTCNIANDSISVIYPGTQFKHEQHFIMPSYDKNQPFVIGMNANGFVTKGGYILLNALKILKRTNPNLSFKARIIYPKFKKISLINLYINIFGLKDIVEICPYQKNMQDFYRSLHCFVCPSKYEAFGRVVAEAMTYKIPTITATNVGVADLIEEGTNGYTFKEHCANNLALKIKTVQSEYENLYTLTENAYNTVNEITWEKFAQQLFNVFYGE